jgi:hypothetical protein
VPQQLLNVGAGKIVRRKLLGQTDEKKKECVALHAFSRSAPCGSASSSGWWARLEQIAAMENITREELPSWTPRARQQSQHVRGP